MKTDDLIDMLARGPAPDPAPPAARLALMAGAGLVASAALMLALLGINPRLAAFAVMPAFWVKVGFVLALAAGGCSAVARLSRPGRSMAGLPLALALPWLVIAALAVVVLLPAEAPERTALILGSSWRVCPFNIAFLSLPLFASFVAIMRTLAPTRLRLAGAATGFAAGAVAACVYCVHCPEIAAPFVGIWYSLGMLIPTAVGAALGPRLLRW